MPEGSDTLDHSCQAASGRKEAMVTIETIERRGPNVLDAALPSLDYENVHDPAEVHPDRVQHDPGRTRGRRTRRIHHPGRHDDHRQFGVRQP